MASKVPKAARYTRPNLYVINKSKMEQVHETPCDYNWPQSAHISNAKHAPFGTDPLEKKKRKGTPQVFSSIADGPYYLCLRKSYLQCCAFHAVISYLEPAALPICVEQLFSHVQQGPWLWLPNLMMSSASAPAPLYNPSQTMAAIFIGVFLKEKPGRKRCRFEKGKGFVRRSF